jgi:diguanylate cyclase (GGDEF)-like protein
VILIEIDGFSRFDGLVGRDGAESVLRSVVGALAEAARHSDVLARFGGEELCLVVPHATPEMLAEAAERLRSAVERHEVYLGPTGSLDVTASFGCAWLPSVTAPGDVVKLIAAAGAELYRAKHAGGNRVAVCREAIASR